jgi:hypothetical protein
MRRLMRGCVVAQFTNVGDQHRPLTKRTLLIGYEKLAKQFEMQHLDDTPERRGLKRMGLRCTVLVGDEHTLGLGSSRVSELSG